MDNPEETLPLDGHGSLHEDLMNQSDNDLEGWTAVSNSSRHNLDGTSPTDTALEPSSATSWSSSIPSSSRTIPGSFFSNKPELDSANSHDVSNAGEGSRTHMPGAFPPRPIDVHTAPSSSTLATLNDETIPAEPRGGQQADVPAPPIDNPDPPAPPPPVVEEERQCRICLGGVEESDELGPLIRPCRCMGTISYVHVQCLNTWRTQSAGRDAFWQCPQCRYKYAFARTRVLGLAESKLALGTMTFILFTVLVFLSSGIVSYFFPEILSPNTAQSARDDSYGYNPSRFSFGWGGGGFYMYDWSLFDIPDILKELVGIAVATFTDVDLATAPVRPAASAPKKPRSKAKTRGGPRYSTGRNRLPTDSDGIVLPSREKGWLARLLARFILGISTLGVASFLQLLLSMSLLAPLQIARGRWFRQRRRDGQGGGVEGIAAIMIGVFVLIGVARALVQVYRLTVYLARVVLTRAETAILDVDGNPHYARPRAAAAAAEDDGLTMRERAVRWAAERAHAWDPRRVLWGPGVVRGAAVPVQAHVHQD